MSGGVCIRVWLWLPVLRFLGVTASGIHIEFRVICRWDYVTVMTVLYKLNHWIANIGGVAGFELNHRSFFESFQLRIDWFTEMASRSCCSLVDNGFCTHGKYIFCAYSKLLTWKIQCLTLYDKTQLQLSNHYTLMVLYSPALNQTLWAVRSWSHC